MGIGSVYGSLALNEYGVATGGIGSAVSTTVNGVSYNYLTFTSDGTLTVTKAGLFDILAFGGGGGGGTGNAGAGAGHGGGGAGGRLLTTVYFSSNQSIKIGAGGQGRAFDSNFGSDKGGDSGIASGGIVAVGGTAGTHGNTSSLNGFKGRVGGSNGGQDASYGTVGYNPDLAILGQGNIGGDGGGGGGGGGGGAGSAGVTGSSSGIGGAGGAGVDVSTFIGGSSLFKAGGGGGSGATTGGAGGSGVGAAGRNGAGSTAGLSADANTAGGGGAAIGNATGGSGGSGIVYVRFRV
jgi:hypothetical protein